MKKKMVKVLSLAFATLMLLSLAACGGKTASSSAASTSTGAQQSQAEGSTTTNSGEGYKIAWSTIYLTPSWMQQTKSMMENRIDKWKEEGVVSEFYIANANGDTSQQIAQIENLIAQKYDAIILIAGSSTALNNVVEKAYDAGIVIINIDSIVSTEKVTSKINTSQIEYGEQCAQWIADSIGGKGKVIVFNGPAGVAVSDERNQGALNVLKNYPDIEVVAELNSEYNEGPAMSVIMPALDANPDVDAVISLGGSLSSATVKAIQQKNMKLIPVTGENYNGFLKEWDALKDKGFSSYCVGQPNWLGTLAVEQAVRALNGEEVKAEVIVPLPVITDETLGEFVPNDFADDGYPIKDITEDEINKFLG